MEISVFITSYNQREYLTEAIDSVLAQTLPASQIIVVDDGSKDGSRELISGYAFRYPVIVPILHQRNQGVAQARNSALEAVTGDYVTFADGDDRFHPTKLEKEARYVHEHPDTQLVYSNVTFIQADGRKTGTWVGKRKPPQGDIFCQTLGREFPRGALFRSEFVETSAWKRVGLYDVSLKIYEDYDMRIRLAKWLRAAYIDEPLSDYRRHGGPSLSGTKAMQKLADFETILIKNRSLLADLSPAEIRYVERRVKQWRARLLRMAAREALGVGLAEAGDKKRAMDLYWRSLRHHRTLDADLIVGLVLPHRAHEAIRSKALELREELRELGH